MKITNCPGTDRRPLLRVLFSLLATLALAASVEVAASRPAAAGVQDPISTLLYNTVPRNFPGTDASGLPAQVPLWSRGNIRATCLLFDVPCEQLTSTERNAQAQAIRRLEAARGLFYPLPFASGAAADAVQWEVAPKLFGRPPPGATYTPPPATGQPGDPWAWRMDIVVHASGTLTDPTLLEVKDWAGGAARSVVFDQVERYRRDVPSTVRVTIQRNTELTSVPWAVAYFGNILGEVDCAWGDGIPSGQEPRAVLDSKDYNGQVYFAATYDQSIPSWVRQVAPDCDSNEPNAWVKLKEKEQNRRRANVMRRPVIQPPLQITYQAHWVVTTPQDPASVTTLEFQKPPCPTEYRSIPPGVGMALFEFDCGVPPPPCPPPDEGENHFEVATILQTGGRDTSMWVVPPSTSNCSTWQVPAELAIRPSLVPASVTVRAGVPGNWTLTVPQNPDRATTVDVCFESGYACESHDVPAGTGSTVIPLSHTFANPGTNGLTATILETGMTAVTTAEATRC